MIREGGRQRAARVIGWFLLVIGAAALGGHILTLARGRHQDGIAGFAASFVMDALFMVVGVALLWLAKHVSGPTERETYWSVLVGRVEDFAQRATVSSEWKVLSVFQRRLRAVVLTLEAGIASAGAGWLVARTSSAEPGVVVAVMLFSWVAPFLWGLTLDPAKAVKWAVIALVPWGMVTTVAAVVVALQNS